MKRLLSSTLAAVCLLALAGCHVSVETDSETRFYRGGTSPDEVRSEMRLGGYDFALLIDASKQQTVTYGWEDSLHFLSYTFGQDGDTTTLDYAAGAPRTDWRIERTRRGDWAIRHSAVPRWVLPIKADSLQVTTAGVEFRLRLYGVPIGHGTFVTDRPEFSSTSLFDQPGLQPLLLHAIVDLMFDGDLDEGMDELMDAWDETEPRSQTEYDHMLSLMPENPSEGDRQAHRAALERVEESARKLGFDNVSQACCEGREDWPWLEVSGGGGGEETCRSRIDALSQAARDEGAGTYFFVQHGGRRHTKCFIRLF